MKKSRKKKAPTPPANIASPDTGSTPASDQRPMVSDKWGIGHSVSGVMPNGEKFSGEVFGYDEATGAHRLQYERDDRRC